MAVSSTAMTKRTSMRNNDDNRAGQLWVTPGHDETDVDAQ
jgi:hypothetical protein